MTQQQHPINPPTELVQQWVEDWTKHKPCGFSGYIASRATRWHSDQVKADIKRERQEAADEELDACCEWFQRFYRFESWMPRDLDRLRAARRPKPPSLKEQALEALDEEQAELSIQNYKLIRTVLESIPDQTSDSD